MKIKYGPTKPKCAVCLDNHERHLERYICSGCGITLCVGYAQDGRDFSRKGSLVHAKEFTAKNGIAMKRLCGVLYRELDAREPEPEAPQQTETNPVTEEAIGSATQPVTQDPAPAR